PTAPLPVDVSIRGMIARIDALTVAKTAAFVSWDDKVRDW
ncbi:MAG: hypothetical protein JWM57_1265, partial [Phycisphaerales bacterium]|nr:hypothetical protein [Phycisphaerales bacterium]